MKQLLIVCSFLFVLGTAMAGTQARNHQQGMVPMTVVADTVNEEVVAYSDTASLDVDTIGSVRGTINWDDENIPQDLRSFLRNLGIGSMVLVVFVVLFALMFLALPIIIVILVLRYLLRTQEGTSAPSAEARVASGLDTPEAARDEDRQWKRGIRNVAIGVGLMAMFWFWGTNILAGIGALVACIGIGQMVAARTSGPRR